MSHEVHARPARPRTWDDCYYVPAAQPASSAAWQDAHFAALRAFCSAAQARPLTVRHISAATPPSWGSIELLVWSSTTRAPAPSSEPEHAEGTLALKNDVKALQGRVHALEAEVHALRSCLAPPPTPSETTDDETIHWAGDWVEQNRTEYLRKWVALRREGLQAVADSLQALMQELRNRGLTQDRLFITRVR